MTTKPTFRAPRPGPLRRGGGIGPAGIRHADDTLRGKGGAVYSPRSGFTLETQHFPDSPNHPEFPSTILTARGAYRSRTLLRFGVR